jgi:hypothetical protein
MGKRSGFFFAILLIASVAQVSSPVATAQSGNDVSGCSSGIVSSVDGSCVGQDDSQFNDQGQLGETSPTAGNYDTSLTQGQLSRQYPGLQNRGLNGGVSTFSDQSGLNGLQAQQQALNEARLLEIQRPSPPTEFQLLVRGLGRQAAAGVRGFSFSTGADDLRTLARRQCHPRLRSWSGRSAAHTHLGTGQFQCPGHVDRSGSVYLPQVGEEFTLPVCRMPR